MRMGSENQLRELARLRTSAQSLRGEVDGLRGALNALEQAKLAAEQAKSAAEQAAAEARAAKEAAERALQRERQLHAMGGPAAVALRAAEFALVEHRMHIVSLYLIKQRLTTRELQTVGARRLMDTGLETLVAAMIRWEREFAANAEVTTVFDLAGGKPEVPEDLRWPQP
jgi:hypothetical protein